MIASNNASSRLGDRSWIKSASTPSPWFAEETADGYRITAGGRYVARVHSEPDALLVVAAPELRMEPEPCRNVRRVPASPAHRPDLPAGRRGISALRRARRSRIHRHLGRTQHDEAARWR